MADIQSNIQVNIDTSNALASIKALQAQISAFQKEMASSSTANALVAKNLQKALIDDINATGKFSASIQTVGTTTDYFTRALEKNKLSLTEYFRYGMASSKSFSRMFQNEFDTVNKVARERVKDLQTQFVSLGKDANGATKAISIRPLSLDLNDLGTKAQIAAQRTQIFNQVLKQGSTNLLNFGKNTQWAGRQLMVGFTIPLSIFGAKAAQEFKKLEEQSIRFKRVYGDSMTTPEEANQMITQLRTLGLEFTKYGVALDTTMQLAADAAAMGKKGNDLLAQVSQASILSVLGGVDQQQALETTISLTNAFGYSADQLTNKVNFLNGVENQTVLNIQDLTEAIPKAGPVIKQLGGSVEDLAFFMTAMKEGGINASEGANALKSGLASLINPTAKASNMLLGMGINLKEIIDQNKGNVTGIITEFGKALDQLDPTTRAQAIEQLFGKFQFARMSTLFKNVVAEGTQAQKVLELTNMTTAQLAAISRKELGQVEQSPLYKFQSAIEKFNAAMAPVGEQFMKMLTPVIDFGTKILNVFNNMSDGAKGFITALIGIVGGIAPVFIMTFGLIANAVANGLKGFLAIKNFITGAKNETTDLGLQTQYMSAEQLQAATVAANLDQVHSKLTQTFTSEAGAIFMLRDALDKAAAAQARFGGAKGSVARGAGKAKNFADGGMVVQGPGGPKDDAIPANLSNGEVVLSVDTVDKNPGIVAALLSGQKIQIPGYKDNGVAGERMHSRQGPGGYEQAHFSGFQQMAGRDMLALAEKGSNLWNAILKKLEAEAKNLGVTTEQVMDHLFQVYDNRVVSMSATLNNAFGRSGSGQTASAAAVKAEFAGSREQAHGMMASQLQRNGVDPETIKSIMTELADQVDKGLSQFGDDVLMTGEDLDGVIQQAYETVLKTAKKGKEELKKAYSELSQISGFASSIKNVKGGNSLNRLSLTDRTSASPFYKADAQRRKNFEAGLEYSPDPSQSYFPRVSKRDIPERYTPAFDAIKKQNPSAATAIIQEEDKRKRLMMIEQEAHKLGIQIAEAAATSVTEGIQIGAKQQLDIQSPSQEAQIIGEQTGEGFKIGAKSKIDEARKVGEQAGDALAQSAASKSNLYGGMTITPELKAARRKFGSVDAIPPAVLKTLTTGLENAGKESGFIANHFNTLSSKMMGISGAISSAMFMLQGFGVNLGALGNVISTLSNAMFTLTSVTQLLGKSEMVTAAANAANLGSFKQVAGLFKGGFFSGLKNLGGSILGFSKGLTGVAGLFARAIPWIGGALLAFEALKFLNEQAKIAQEKITGLGDAALLTSDKLQKIGDAFGFDPAKAVDLGARIGTKDVAAGDSKTLSAKDKLLSVYEGNTTEDKLNKFKDENRAAINGLGNASANQATRALSSQARQMYAAGATKEAVGAQIRTLIDSVENNPELKKVNVGKIIGTIFDPKNPESTKAITDSAQTSANALSTAFKNYKPPVQDMTNTGPAYTGRGSSWSAAYGGMQGGQAMGMNDDIRKEMALAASETVASTQAISQAFSDQTISADKLIETVDGIYGPFQKLSDEQLAKFIPVLEDQLGPAFKEQTKDITDYRDKLYMAQYTAAGGVITEGQVNKIKKGASAVSVLGASYGKLARDTDKARAAEVKKQAVDASAVYLKAKTQGLQEQIDAYHMLIDAGYSAADALAASNDETIRAAIIAKGTAKDIEGLAAFLKANSEWSKISSSGGSTKANPFKDAVDSLKQQKAEIVNSLSAYTKLKKAGVDMATAFEMAQDPTIAAGVAAAKTAKQLKQLADAAKAVAAARAKNGYNNFSAEMNVEKEKLKNQAAMATALAKTGASAAEIDQLMGNENLVASFKAGKVNAEQLAEALKKVRANADIQLQIKMATPEGMQSVFDDMYSKIQEKFSAQENAIQLDFKLGTNLSGKNGTLVNMKEIDKAIETSQNKIAGMNNQMNKFNAGITEISWKEDEVNKKYEARSQALDKIQKANDAITRQNKEQLTIADAITQGDIAAAAKAIEDKRASDASAAMESQKQAMDTAKQAELAALTDSNGRTRAQLEASILDLKKQIFAEEENILKPAEEARRQAEMKLKAATDSITVLGKNKDEWEQIKSKVDTARTNSEKYKEQIDKALGTANSLVAAWNSLNTTITTTHVINTVTNGSAPAASGSTGTGSTGTGTKGTVTVKSGDTLSGLAAKNGMTTAEIIKANPQISNPNLIYPGQTVNVIKKAFGGLINWQSSGTDTVPAMLTPGEFVMNKASVSKYGIGMMKALNSGSYVPSLSAPVHRTPGNSPAPRINATNKSNVNNSSVYNYSITVNSANGNAGAQDIANTVMGRIRAVDSQKIRGVRI
jgi:TP901 family phage tail tape measure protein